MAVKKEKTRQVLTDEIYESIKSLLMDHDIQPGDRVSIDDLARRLKVSQTPIREALARLESDELVVRKPLAGYSATPILTPSQLVELYEFRFLVEPRAVENATKVLTSEGIEQLKAELAEGKKIHTGSTYSTYRQLSEHDARFHQLIFKLARNGFIESAFLKSHCHLHLFRLSPTSPSAQQKALREHGVIVKAMIARDPKVARAAMVSHLEGSRDRMLPYVFTTN
ncbi:MAG: GntR family transcriptional regulator [Actinomycetes bacterium]